MFFLPYESFKIFFLKSLNFRIFFSSSITILSILKPLLTIALLTSLFDDKILLLAIRSINFTPFFISSVAILISGRSELVTPFSKVSLAVCSAFSELSLHEVFLLPH